MDHDRISHIQREDYFILHFISAYFEALDYDNFFLKINPDLVITILMTIIPIHSKASLYYSKHSFQSHASEDGLSTV